MNGNSGSFSLKHDPIPEHETRPLFLFFATKLDRIMDLAGISNASLGRHLGVDPSTISRFRSGRRSPKDDRDMIDWFTGKLLEIIPKESAPRFRELTGIDLLKLTKERAEYEFKTWLFDYGRGITGREAETLLAAFDSADDEPPEISTSDEDLEAIASAEIADDYYGVEGLKNAFIRFFGRAEKAGEGELLMYSDQRFDFLFEDRAFLRRWGALFVSCIKKGVKVKVIHSVDRTADDMIRAVKLWLPLYRSGDVESFATASVRDREFSNTLLINKGVEAIVGSFVSGAENSAVYRYVTDAKQLDFAEKQFTAILSRSGRFVRGFRHSFSNELSDTCEDRIIISNAPTLPSMPESLLKKVTARSGLPREREERLYRIWETARENMIRTLEGHTVTECFPLASMAFDTDIPSVSSGYTKEEYASHLRHILDLSVKYPNYRIVLLDRPMFKGTRVSISPSSVSVTKTVYESTVYRIAHPALLMSFSDYAEALIKKHCTNRIDVGKQIEKYIKDMF